MLADITQLNTWFDYRRKRFWALLLVVLYTFAGFVLLPWAIAKFGPELARDETQREVSIGEVSFNPWTLRLELKDLALIDNDLIDDDQRNLLTLDSLIINVAFTDLLQLTLGFDEISLNRPQVNLTRYAFADSNWGRMLNDIEAASPPAAEPEPAVEDEADLRLHIIYLAINDGVVNLEDALTEDTFNTTIQPINIAVNDLSTLEDVTGSEAITLTTENGVELTWEGSVKLNPLLSEGSISLSGTPLPTVYRYFEKQLGFTLDNCCLEIDFAYDLRALESGDVAVNVRDANLVLSNFNLNTKESDEPVLRMPALRIDGGSLAWPEQVAHIDAVVLEKPELYVWLDEDGVANLEKLVKAPAVAEADNAEQTSAGDIATEGNPDLTGAATTESTATQDGAAKAGNTLDASPDGSVQAATESTATQDGAAKTGNTLDASPDGSVQATTESTASGGSSTEVADAQQRQTDKGATEAPKPQADLEATQDQEGQQDQQEKPWIVTLDEFRIENMTLGVADRSLKTPGQLELQAMNLSITDISSQPDSRWPVVYAAEVTTGGTLAFNGQLTALPEVKAGGSLKVDALQLAALQPWASEAAQIELQDGQLNLALDITSDPTETLTLAGDVNVTSLNISDTIKNESLVGWQALNLNALQFALDANSLQLGQVELDQPFVRLLIARDGTTNFDALATGSDADAATSETTSTPKTVSTSETTSTSETNSTPAEETAPLTVKVGSTQVDNAAVDFADQSLPLPFRVMIEEFSGTLSAINSESKQPSALDFKGRIGEFGQAKLTGDVSVMAPEQQTAVQLDFANLNMPTLSPYTAEFVGRAIESGKLDLALDYTLENNRINGSNNMVLTDFSLGEPVPSDDAMSLPLDLALALLTDANGVIDIDLQVSGDMDDPGFSASGIVLKAFANLITKAATAPFKLLGNLIPGGSDVDLEGIDFEPGRADLNPPEREKLLLVLQALEQRPTLQLQLNGGYQTEVDTAALQAINLNNQLTSITGSEPSPKATRKALEKMAKQQLAGISLGEMRDEYNRPNPETGKRQFDELAYAAELRSRLEALQPVDEQYLQTLARQRQDMMQVFLQSQGGEDAARPVVIVGELIEVDEDARGNIRIPLVLTPTQK